MVLGMKKRGVVFGIGKFTLLLLPLRCFVVILEFYRFFISIISFNRISSNGNELYGYFYNEIKIYHNILARVLKIK